MDKAQAIHLEACILQSWWEFAVDCAIHIYNCTPIQHHNQETLVENLEYTKPDVTHFCVFGCGAYSGSKNCSSVYMFLKDYFGVR